MNNREKDRLHAWLDGEELPHNTNEEQSAEEEFAFYREVLSRFNSEAESAPDGFAAKVMASLPESRYPSKRLKIYNWIFGKERLGFRAVALAASLAVLALGIWMLLLPSSMGKSSNRVRVTFQMHAPQAKSLELVGSFNDWQRGVNVMKGPDALGQWSITLELKPGRYEYIFLVNNKDWVSDPRAADFRPDGFGRKNALLEL